MLCLLIWSMRRKQQHARLDLYLHMGILLTLFQRNLLVFLETDIISKELQDVKLCCMGPSPLWLRYLSLHIQPLFEARLIRLAWLFLFQCWTKCKTGQLSFPLMIKSLYHHHLNARFSVHGPVETGPQLYDPWEDHPNVQTGQRISSGHLSRLTNRGMATYSKEKGICNDRPKKKKHPKMRKLVKIWWNNVKLILVLLLTNVTRLRTFST